MRNNQNNRSSGRGGSAPYAKGGKPQQQQQQQPIRLTTEKLAVSNLAHSVSEADVRELFKQIGEFSSAKTLLSSSRPSSVCLL